MPNKSSERVAVYVRTPGELFSPEIHYQIPSFQRRYIWNKTKHWRPLWDDVRRIAENIVSGEPHSPHFLGAVVLQDVSTPIGEPQTKLVVDGQQRLTTLQLLIDAVHKSSTSDGYQPDDSLSELVWNDDKRTNGSGPQAFKVWPTVIDRPCVLSESFQWTVRRCGYEYLGSTRVFQKRDRRLA